MFSLFQEIKPYSIPKKLSVFMGWGKVSFNVIKWILPRPQITDTAPPRSPC